MPNCAAGLAVLGVLTVSLWACSLNPQPIIDPNEEGAETSFDGPSAAVGTGGSSQAVGDASEGSGLAGSQAAGRDDGEMMSGDLEGVENPADEDDLDTGGLPPNAPPEPDAGADDFALDGDAGVGDEPGDADAGAISDDEDED